jgi:PilZ domain
MRRSSRLTIQIPVEVICKGAQNSVRVEETRTVVVSAHGCALMLKAGVMPGDTVVVIHKMSREEVSCRVVMCRQSKDGNWDTGLEFREPSPKFWHIAFPPDDWDPSFRDGPAHRVVKK